MNIRPIETRYKGYRFRSRLEARWAVFFDALRIQWEYEKEGYQLPSGPYLPDFWLPEFGVWLEVKGQEPTDQEKCLCRELRNGTGHAVLLVHGLPSSNLFSILIFAWDCSESGGGESEWEGTWGSCCGETEFWVVGASDRIVFLDGQWNRICNELPSDAYVDRVSDAINAARSARFEHGEHP